MASSVIGNLVAKFDSRELKVALGLLFDIAGVAKKSGKALKDMGAKGAKGAKKLSGALLKTGTVVLGLSKKLLALALNPVIALGALAAAMGAATGAAVNYGSEIKNAATASGFSTDRLQTLEAAFVKMGLTSDQARDSLIDFGEKIGETLTTGSGAAADALEVLGLKTKVMNGELEGTDEIFDAVFEQISKIEDPLQRQFLLTELGADGFRQLSGSVGEGTDALFQYEQEARNAGIITSENIDKADALKDGFVNLAKDGFRAASQALLDLLPPADSINTIFTTIKGLFTTIVGAFQNTFIAIKDVVGILVDVFLPADAVSKSFEAIGNIVTWVSGIFTSFATNTRVKVIGVLGNLLETIRNVVAGFEGIPGLNHIMPDSALANIDSAIIKINDLKDAAIEASKVVSEPAPSTEVIGSSLTDRQLSELGDVDTTKLLPPSDTEVAKAKRLADAERERTKLKEKGAAEREKIEEDEAATRTQLLNDVIASDISREQDEIARIQQQVNEKIRLKKEEIGGAMALTAEFIAWEVSAREDAAEEIRDIEKDIADKKRESVQEYSDYFVDSLISGKDAMKNFALSIIEDMVRINAKKFLLSFLTDAGGGLNGAGGVISSALVALGLAPRAAQGGVSFGGEFRPTGTFIGETGAEAYLPLKAMSNGDMGIQADIGGGGGSVVNNMQTVNVTTNSDNPSEIGNAVVKALIQSEVRNTIVSEQRSGGLLGR